MGARVTEPNVRTERSDTVSVLVVDDHPIVLDGVRLLVDSTSWITLAGYARTGREAITVAEQTQPDVVLLDLRLPDMLGPEVIHGILRGAPDAKVVLFTAYPDHAAVEPALAAGARAVVLKDADRADLVGVLRRVAAGETIPATAGGGADAGAANQQLARKLRQWALTRREYDILRRISMGETNPEIAEALGLTRNTVKTYVQSALNKLGARNRIEALNRLHEGGLL
ncbi:MAG TPA: response regulator transcription factor [Acidimicrobiales bacterium]|nr:response regulator transcription factor [Acidimicrobiales bacterium]